MFLIKSDIKSGNDVYFSICKYLNCFGGFDDVLSDVSCDIDLSFRNAINSITSDIVIDYLFNGKEDTNEGARAADLLEKIPKNKRRQALEMLEALTT